MHPTHSTAASSLFNTITGHNGAFFFRSSHEFKNFRRGRIRTIHKQPNTTSSLLWKAPDIPRLVTSPSHNSSPRAVSTSPFMCWPLRATSRMSVPTFRAIYTISYTLRSRYSTTTHLYHLTATVDEETRFTPPPSQSFLLVFINSSRQMPGYYPALRHNRFLPPALRSHHSS